MRLVSTAKCDAEQLLIKHMIKNPIIETVVEYNDPKLKYLGEYKITHYCACMICCGKTNGITASGAHVQENHTIAVDPKIIPLGSKVLINGIIYTAEDTGGAIKEKRIDIYVPTHQEAINKGVDYADVYLLY